MGVRMLRDEAQQIPMRGSECQMLEGDHAKAHDAVCCRVIEVERPTIAFVEVTDEPIVRIAFTTASEVRAKTIAFVALCR